MSLTQGHLTRLDVFELLALIGAELSIIRNFLLQGLIHAGEVVLIGSVVNLWIQVKDWGNKAVGAEDTGKLGIFTEVQLTAGGYACQRIQECGFIVTRADPTNMGLATAGICPESSAGDVLAHFVGLDDGIISRA